MKRKILILLLVVVVFVLSVVAIRYILHVSRWKRYYQEKLYLPPRDMLTQALALFGQEHARPGNALDLGAGAGNETAFLLKEGWHVWAVDSEPLALKTIVTRNDIISFASGLTTIVSRFEDMNWHTLAPMKLIHASYSLPFVTPVKFDQVWNNVVSILQQGGRFAGTFFGDKHQGCNEKDTPFMTFLTKDQVLNLFKDFNVEVFEEINEKTEKRPGVFVGEHVFNVIAKKQS